jgi:hypothetical protein
VLAGGGHRRFFVTGMSFHVCGSQPVRA